MKVSNLNSVTVTYNHSPSLLYVTANGHFKFLSQSISHVFKFKDKIRTIRIFYYFVIKLWMK